MKHLKKIGYVFGAVFILCALIFASCVGPGPDNPLAVTGVTLSASTLILNVGASGQLTATVQPSDAQNKNVTWSSSNTSVATVQSGLVTAVGTGTAIITVVTDDGAYKAMCTVTVPAAGTAVTGVLLSSSLSLKVGASGQLTATVQPSTAANKNVTWSSSNNNIATVSNGLVTGESVGTATIIVTTVEGGFTANCTVTVTPSGNEHVAVTDVSLNLPTFSMDVGEDRPLTPEVLPVNATNKAVSWSSSNTSVVTVSNGLVIGVGVGTAIITVTTVDGGFEDTTVFTITEPDINHPVTGVTLDEDEIDLYEGDSTILTANVTPDNATEKGKTWSSSNEDVATIDANGNVSAHSAGSTIITVTTDEGDFTDTCTVTVLKKIVDVPVSSVSLSPSTLTLNVGGKGELTANVLPVNATNKARIWTSSNEDVAIVDVNGIVTALSVGEATITVIMIENLNITAESTVEVTSAVIPDVAVSGVTLDEDEIELYEGDATILTANVTPDNATDKGKTWSSSDDDVATVDVNGNVSAHSAGTAIITVKTDDGDFTDTSIVTVIKKIVNVPVSSVSLSPSILTLNVGGEGELTANIAPVNATNKARSWSSDNPGVATVDLNGIVTAHSAGTATITVTTADGGKTATSTVTVRTPPIAVTGVRLSQTSLSLDKGDEADLVAFVDPADAANLDVAWSSSNPSVATVSNGLVIGMGVGTAIITVTTDDGGFEASCTVTVTEEIVAPSTPHDVTIRIDGFEDVTFASSYADGTIGVDPAYDLKAWYVNGAKYEGDIDSLNQFLTTLSLGTYNIKLIALDDNEVPYSNNIEVEITENDEPDPSSSFNISIIIGSFEDAYFASSHDDGTIGVDPAYDLKAWYLNGVKQEGTIDDLNSFIATLGQGDYEIKLIALDRNNVPYSNIVTLEVY